MFKLLLKAYSLRSKIHSLPAEREFNIEALASVLLKFSLSWVITIYVIRYMVMVKYLILIIKTLLLKGKEMNYIFGEDHSVRRDNGQEILMM